MDFTKEYSDYAAIEKHIRAHRIERAVKIAVFISRALTALWEEIQAPPRPPMLVPIDRRREARVDSYRAGKSKVAFNPGLLSRN